MQKAFFPICILLLFVQAPAQAGRWTSPKVHACDSRGPDSAQDVTLVNFTFTHTPSLSPSDKARIRKEIRTTISPCGVLDEELQEIPERVRRVYREHGYFKALVEDPQWKVIRGNGSPEVIEIIISVEEGRQYRFKDMSFIGGTVFPNDVLREQFSIKGGEIFNTEKIHTGLDRLHGLYGACGYVNFTPVVDTVIDEDNGFISLNIDINEGKLFRWGELLINGTESQPGARQSLLKAWQAYKGCPYDGDIALRHLLRDIHALPSVDPGEVFQISKDESSGLINVHLTLVKPPREFLQYLRADRVRTSRHK